MHVEILALRRSQQEIKYALKVKATENHPTRSVTEFYYSKKFKPNNVPLYSKTFEFFEEVKNVVYKSVTQFVKLELFAYKSLYCVLYCRSILRPASSTRRATVAVLTQL